MSVVAQIKDGKVVETASQASLSNQNTNKSSDGMDKNAFLQLLVAQMRYQDPLEPTSNTEYVSQFAQFSQVEQMQNMAGTLELQRASSLVGQDVYIKTTGSNGDTKYVQGQVDYVVYEGGKPYLAIDESLYSIDDLDTVMDKDYWAAYSLGSTFVEKYNALPAVNSIDYTNVSKVEELENAYNNMSAYEKSFVAKDVISGLQQYIERAKQVREAMGEDE